MKTTNKRLHTQELKRRSKLSTEERMVEWKKTREGIRQFKKK